MSDTVKNDKTRPPKAHGGGVRGDNSTSRSSTREGRFGRMFRSLPAADFDKEALTILAGEMTADPETDPKDKNFPAASLEDPKKRIQDNEENAGIPSGYTYLGQFIDHDITFDPASSLQQRNDPDALIDFRTPRLDLDSVYGRGPADQPYLYDGGNAFLGGDPISGGDANARDLPRNTANPRRALIGDPRNDENTIVSQFQGLLLRFHN